MRFYRIILNLASSVSRSMVGLILGLFATPIILDLLGEEQFGAFRVLVDWTGQLGILEFGLFTALLPIFAGSLAGKVRLSPAAVAHQAFYKYIYVVAYQLAGFFFIFIFLDVLIPVSPENRKDLQLAAMVMCGSLTFTFMQIYRAYVDASQRGYILSSTMLLQNVLQIALSILFAYFGWGITGQTISFTLGIAGSFLILYVYTFNDLKVLRKRSTEKRNFDAVLKKQRSSHFWANLFGRVSLLVDNMVISAFLGAKTVTGFYLTQRLLKIGMQQLGHLSNSTWPAMSEIFYSKDRKVFADRVIDLTEFISFAAGVLLTVLVLVNPSFVILWTGEETFAGIYLSNMVALNCGLYSLASFWLWCFGGTGQITKAIPLLAVQAGVNLAISIIGTYYLGVIGPALGTFVSFLLIHQIWMTIILNKEFQIPILALTRAWMIPFLLPISITTAVTTFYGYPKFSNWIYLILGSLGLGVTATATFPYLFIRPASRYRIYYRLAELAKKKFKVKSPNP